MNNTQSTTVVKHTFYQFPLCILAYGVGQQEKLNSIAAFATINAGLLKETEIGEQAAIRILSSRSFSDFDIDDPYCRAWALGKEIVHWSWHDSPDLCLQIYYKVSAFVYSSNKSPWVRVSTDLYRDTVSGDFDFRDFCALCAVYAIIGDKQYSIVRRDRVRAGALGYSSAKVLFNEDGELTQEGKLLLSTRADKAELMTVNQCRYTLNRLHQRKFFSRIQPVKSGRAVYYSRSADHEKLAEMLLSRMERRATTKTAQQTSEQAFREKAAALLKRSTPGDGSLLNRSQSGENFSPGSNRTITADITAGVTGTVTGEVTALILSSPNKCFLNECSPNECPPNGEGGRTPEGEQKESKPKEEPAPKAKCPMAELMATAKRVFGARELKASLGRWMKRAELEPDKFRRVLAATETQQKEYGLENPVAWAEEQWNQAVTASAFK